MVLGTVVAVGRRLACRMTETDAIARAPDGIRPPTPPRRLVAVLQGLGPVAPIGEGRVHVESSVATTYAPLSAVGSVIGTQATRAIPSSVPAPTTPLGVGVAAIAAKRPIRERPFHAVPVGSP